MTSIDTKLLRMDVMEGGPKDGHPVLLLHGWPDDATTWDRVAPYLHGAGFRTIVPMQRAFGGTRFLSDRTERTGNAGVLCMDAIELMDALGVEQFFVAGHDWGSNIAEGLAVGWPKRVTRIAMLSTPSRLGGLKTPPFEIARSYWYHWFQAIQVGAGAVADDPIGFARVMWDTWSPEGWFDEETFREVAASFENPDWFAVTNHSYRSRWGEAPIDTSSIEIEAKIKATEGLATPTLFFHGQLDGVTPCKMTKKRSERFTGSFERIVLDGVGHFPTREAPDIVGKKLVEHFGAGT